jgi:hypothetical protein
MRADIDLKIYKASVDIFFKTPTFFPFVLRQQLTTIDFVSYCGGSLGLFLGFSAISLIEIVYYFTLRIICLKRQKAKVTDSSQTIEPAKTSSYPVEIIENSSIHGCNQIVMANRHWIERILWIVLVSTAVVFCTTTTYSFYIKYKDTPIMMKYEDSIDSSQEITFPAITFNNEHTSSYLRVEQILFRHFPPYEAILNFYGERLVFIRNTHPKC